MTDSSRGSALYGNYCMREWGCVETHGQRRHRLVVRVGVRAGGPDRIDVFGFIVSNHAAVG